MVIELRVVQFWSEIILVISNQTRAARSFDFEITRMISDQIALHSVQLPIFIFSRFKHFSFFSVTSFVLAGMIYTMPQIKPFNWCITVGVGVHSCRFTKIRHFLWE